MSSGRAHDRIQAGCVNPLQVSHRHFEDALDAQLVADHVTKLGVRDPVALASLPHLLPLVAGQADEHARRLFAEQGSRARLRSRRGPSR